MTKLLPYALVSFLLVSCAGDAGKLNLIREYETQKNNGNLEAVLQMFAEDAVLNFGPMGSLSGLDHIRGIHEYDIAIDTRLRFSDCTVNNNEVACRTVETNEWLRLAGIESLAYDESLFQVSPDGRIQSVAVTLSPESSQSLGIAMARFDAWARANRPDEYSALFSAKGAFVYSSMTGDKVLALLRQWRTAAEVP